MKAIDIICPSYKRAHLAKTQTLFGKDLTFAIHEFDAESYQECFPDNPIMVLPDETLGNMAKVRNYILTHSTQRWLLMVDDDCSAISFYEDLTKHHCSREEITSLLRTGCEMAADLGTPLWGINLIEDPDAYREYTPFSFLSPILGPFTCIDRDTLKGCKYDERLGLNEDYDFFIQICHQYHKALRFNKYHYMAAHLDMEMGCAAYRTLDKELAQAEIMIRKWGSKVVRYDFSKSTNPRVRIPLKGL